MELSIRHVLTPTDFSEPSLQAVRYAHQMARHFGARLTLVHVIQDLAMVLPDALMPNPTPAPALEDFVGHAEAQLARLIEAEGMADVSARGVTRVGTPYGEITQLAEDEHADLLVIGTHGRTGLAHVLLGSVAERILRHSPCPVLTVRHRTG